jgi:hypothetical protein
MYGPPMHKPNTYVVDSPSTTSTLGTFPAGVLHTMHCHQGCKASLLASGAMCVQKPNMPCIKLPSVAMQT